MKKLLLVTLLSISASTKAIAAGVILATEEYPPFSYRDGKTIKGASVEQVEKVMKDAGIDYKIAMMPWARAYNLAQTTPMSCVFTTAHSAKRDPMFTWVEPLLVDRNILITRSGSGVTAKNLEEARQYTIGTQREDYTEATLKENGFTKLDVATDFNATLRKLLNGRIDMMPISEIYFTKLKTEQPLEKVTVLSTQPMGIACEKNFPSDLLARMQEALDNLIADGTQKTIFTRYGLSSEN
ncbi:MULTISPECIES: transporter substrate-binding domain-containing protein [unclassified Rhizobium]|uniref:substrate-binding periplasmic protein n=1 Tax=unclassified Rhizobium TaxID=2613769 RepID=UPI00104894DF|nr:MULTISPECIES: transporter substrate-binding domain-containing protein [unclassified Rhizobium]MBB3394635.1 polar amino acid transport system substrate-binding protein [Rhizobium sp. BK060]MBB4167874.1 polar amino acid transport system substrate-binding protein [Rhizobium sp. BK538]TCM79109.1 amino acid ABC transporter substrate-binding protein (PAAT family) [Rhizobium sp. BK068]